VKAATVVAADAAAAVDVAPRLAAADAAVVVAVVVAVPAVRRAQLEPARVLPVRRMRAQVRPAQRRQAVTQLPAVRRKVAVDSGAAAVRRSTRRTSSDARARSKAISSASATP
jgi:hypothetical protein